MFHIGSLGETGLRVQFGDHINSHINRKLRRFATLLHQENISGVIEWIPTYTAITIYYNPYVISYRNLKKQLVNLENKLSNTVMPPAKVIHIPTYYGESSGPDLSVVAKHNQLDEEDVISIHSNNEYLIYMLGFIPGFPYLGGMSNQIATPRLAEPRSKIPAGSVGIAGEQTGIYPMETPGGWQLIGRTPLPLYNPKSEVPILLEAGNYIRFIRVSASEYNDIERKVNEGYYTPHIEPYIDQHDRKCRE